MVKLLYIDNWGGKNYGCYPISTPGKSLKDKLDASAYGNYLSQKTTLMKEMTINVIYIEEVILLIKTTVTIKS